MSKKCSQCDRDSEARGYCLRCYQTARRNRTFEAPICIIPDCDRVRCARGYCKTHYKYFRRTGTHPQGIAPIGRNYASRVPKEDRVPLRPLIELIDRNRITYWHGERENLGEFAGRINFDVKKLTKAYKSATVTVPFALADEICTAIGYYVEHLEEAS